MYGGFAVALDAIEVPNTECVTFQHIKAHTCHDFAKYHTIQHGPRVQLSAYNVSASWRSVCMQTDLLGLQGFKIIFDFSDNSYFSNKELVKTYYMVSDDAEDPVLQRATGTPIQWASGKNPGVKVSLIICILS